MRNLRGEEISSAQDQGTKKSASERVKKYRVKLKNYLARDDKIRKYQHMRLAVL